MEEETLPNYKKACALFSAFLRVFLFWSIIAFLFVNSFSLHYVDIITIIVTNYCYEMDIKSLTCPGKLSCHLKFILLFQY